MSESGVDKKEISTMLQEGSVLLELKGENFFKVKAYLHAAKSVQILEEDPEETTRQGHLKEI
jgi:DNA polymerase (family X)